MSDDPATGTGRRPVDTLAAVLAGHRGDEGAAREALDAPDPATRAAALGALARMEALDPATTARALGDPAPAVRRRACDEAAGLPAAALAGALGEALRRALADGDPLVVVSACWALGEHRYRPAVAELSAVARRHPDSRCRESAVAALGALGDPDGLAAVLAALEDRPTVRRRAVVALAAFEGPEVDGALRRALEDRDWQVRQAAEVLLED